MAQRFSKGIVSGFEMNTCCNMTGQKWCQVLTCFFTISGGKDNSDDGDVEEDGMDTHGYT